MAIWQTEATGDHAKFLKIKNRMTSVFYSSFFIYSDYLDQIQAEEVLSA